MSKAVEIVNGAVHPSRDDVDPDSYPDDSPLSPAEWLAEHVTDRLGDLDYVDGHTFGGARATIEPGRLTGPDADPPRNQHLARRCRRRPPGAHRAGRHPHRDGDRPRSRIHRRRLAEAATLLGP